MTDEGQSEMFRRLLQLALGAGLAGAGLRTTASVFRNANARYEPPEVPKPVIVDVPYYTNDPIGRSVPVPGREKKAMVSLKDLPGGEWLDRNLTLPPYTPPIGKPGETDPANVPVMGAGSVLAGAAGGVGGYFLADRLLRAADRWRAERDLEAAKAEYQKAVQKRLSGTKLAAKSAATDEPTKEAADAHAAIGELYAAVKRAGDDEKSHWSLRALASGLWPGLMSGSPGVARANMGIAALMGLGGGYMGYRAVRDPAVADAHRKAIKDRDRANAEHLPAPVVARLIPQPMPVE